MAHSNTPPERKRKSMNTLLTKSILALGALLASAGCSTVRPIPSEQDRTSFSSKVGQIDSSNAMKRINDEIATYLTELAKTADAKAGNDWNTGDATFIGAVMAAVGGLADRTGLLNTGVGLAGLGVASRERYQFPAQTRAYDTARKRLVCVQTATQRLDDSILNQVRVYDDADVQTAVRNIPSAIIKAVDKIKDQLRADLRAVASEPPSRDSLLEYLRRFQDAAKVPADAGNKAAKAVGLMKSTPMAFTGAADNRLTKDDHAAIAKLNENVVLAKALPLEVEGCTSLTN